MTTSQIRYLLLYTTAFTVAFPLLAVAGGLFDSQGVGVFRLLLACTVVLLLTGGLLLAGAARIHKAFGVVSLLTGLGWLVYLFR